MAKPISITETLDLSDFRLPMQPIPLRVEQAIAKGVDRNQDVTFEGAPLLLGPDADGRVDGVIRNRDGTMTVACLTEMPGVSPEMVDWWFGWRLPSSERFRLAHPKAHRKSAAALDRARERDPRARYVGNVAYVDAQIGPDLMKLAIAFFAPSDFSLDPARVDQAGTAICGRVALRERGIEIARLVHFVRRTNDGAEMLSRFYLGDMRFTAPAIGPLLSLFANTRRQRRRAIRDDSGLYLLRHCAEEMNHLAQILPGLYERFGGDKA